MFDQKLHDTSVKLWVLYYEERVLGINRPPAEITALTNRIKAWVSVIYPDGRKYAEADKAVKTLYSKR